MIWFGQIYNIEQNFIWLKGNLFVNLANWYFNFKGNVPTSIYFHHSWIFERVKRAVSFFTPPLPWPHTFEKFVQLILTFLKTQGWLELILVVSRTSFVYAVTVDRTQADTIDTHVSFMDWYRTNLDTGYLVKSRYTVLKLAPKRIEKALMDVLTLTILKKYYQYWFSVIIGYSQTNITNLAKLPNYNFSLYRHNVFLF